MERGAGESPGPPPVHARTTAPAGQRGPCHRHRRPLVNQRRQAWEHRDKPVSAARWGSAMWHTLAWAVFGPPTSAPSSSCRRAAARRPGTCCCCSRPVRLSAYIGATVSEVGFLRGFWMDGSRRLAWLEDYAASLVAAPIRRRRPLFAAASGSSTCRSRIRARRDWCSTTSLSLPPGSVVAIVGENGAGKTTLVKLLAKMYEPTSGSIFVDDTPLARVPRRPVARAARRRVSGLLSFRVPRRARPSALATSRVSTTSRPSSTAVERAGAATCSRVCRQG